MMKRLIAWALTLALVFSAVPVVISAEGIPAAHSHSAAQHDCEHCDGTITWTAWSSTTSLPKTTGHYYLTADVNVSAQTQIVADQNVVICLNGWNISGGYKPEDITASKSFSIFDVRGKLTISDCTAYTDEEGVLHAGKIQKGYRTDSGGTAFWCRNATAILTLHDVILCDHYSPFTTSTWGGGALYIRDGAKAELYNCYITRCKSDAEGGVALLRSNSTLIANGCTFENNTAKAGGSVIYSPNGNTVTLQDCTIKNNNFAGKDKNYLGAVYLSAANDKLILSGKTVIDGNFAAMDGTPSEQNIYLQRELSDPVDIGGLTDGAKISIRTHYTAPATPTFVKCTTAPTNWYHGYVLFENTGKAIAYNAADGFHFVENDIHEHCECGSATCTDSAHQKVEYKPWNNKTSLPSSGNYYLNTDVDLTNETSVTADLNLCLHGHTVKAATGKQIITTPKGNTLTLVITDCTATTVDGVYTAGVLTGGVDAGKGRGGGAIFIRDSGNLKLYDGILTGNTSDLGGGAIRLGANTTFQMHGGEISGNTAITGTTYKTGGAISAIAGSSITITGGTIKNNRGGNGGAIYSAGTVTITGGTITANTGDKGGAIFVEGSLTAQNATFTGNTAPVGGAVYVEKNKTAALKNCTIKENKASGEGAAAIYVNTATLNLDGCSVTDNRVTAATAAGGSAIYSPASSTITLKNTTITGNTHAGADTAYRGAVYTSGVGDKLILIGDVVINDNYVANDGAKLERNIFLQRKLTTPMDVGGLTDGTELSVFTHYATETEPAMVKADKAPTGWVRGWVIYDNNEMAVDYDAAQNKFYFTLNAEHIHCECGATDCADTTHKLVGYKAWNDATSLPTSGNYFLNVDVNLAGETGVTGDLNLCLHGHTVTAAKDQQIITTRNNTDLTLTIADCTATYENGQYKAGKLTGGFEKASLGRGGGAIFIRAEGNMKLYDGIITGNTSGTGGGAIRLGKNATFVMHDGEISDNLTINGTTLRTGGAISAITETQITILGGTIKNNKGGNGGAIYTEGELTVRGGTITGNSGTNGGAIFVMDKATLQLLGGRITDNQASVSAGGIYVSAGGKITVGGDSVVKGNAKNGTASNLQLQGNVIMTLEQVSEKAFVGISAESVFRAISTKTDKNLSAQFVSDRATMMVLYQDSALYIGAADGHKHCLCAGLNAAGCNHQGTAFAPWDDTTSLPTSGNWYLTADVNLVASKTLNTEELNLCLNGYNINLASCEQGRLVYLKGTGKLAITDCTEKTGVISGATQSAVQFENNKAATPVFNLYNGVFTNNTSIHGGGGAVLLQGSGTFNMYGGKLTGNYIEASAKVDASGNPVLNTSGVQQVTNQLGGGAVCVYGTNATTNIYGGVISNNWAKECQRLNAAGSLETVGGTGGAIYTESNINIYGGQITGNHALDGGGVLGATRVVITMTGGTVSSNIADRNGGGLVSFRGELHLSGGVISENTAKAGGGIRGQGVVLLLNGTHIINNSAADYAGGIRLSQDLRNGVVNPNKFVFTAGSVSGNRSKTAGGILFEGAGSEMVMTGGEISKNTAADTAGGAYISTGTTFHMEGGKIFGNTAKTGGGIRVFKSTFNLKDGVITGNKATSNCGGVYVSYEAATMNFMGGEISKNITESNAGGVLVENGATMNYSAGKVTGNAAKAGGGGIFISASSVLNMTGGTVSGNTAKSGAGIYCFRGKQLTLAGGSVSYNTAEVGGGGMQASGGSLTFKGTNLIGNKVIKGYGGGIRATGASVKKNGVTTVYPSTTVMYGGIISNNSATSGGGVLLEQKGSTWTMYGGSVSNNATESAGAGIYASRNTKLYVYGGKINNNTAKSSGAGVYHLVSQGVYKNCEISGNTGLNGTITCGKTCEVELENVTMTGNTVTRYGGAVYTETSGKATVKNCTFVQNTTGILGGALFSNTGAYLTVTDCVFTENHSEKRGGAIGIYDNAPIVGCVFTGNSAINGGAIYSGDESQRISCNGWGDTMSKAGMQVVDCEFKDNVATENGGAMYAYMSCYVDVINTTFTGNKAELQGGAIWCSENLNMEDLIITGNASASNGYAVFLADAEYDGHSYIRGLMKISGDMLITDNQGGDLYLDKTTTLSISSAGLGKNTEMGVTLDSGLLTQRLFGSYDYEGGDCVYTVTYGDRSLTDPEYDPTMVIKPAENDQDQQKKSGTDVLLYVGIGVIALLAVGAAALVLAKKKSKEGTK